MLHNHRYKGIIGIQTTILQPHHYQYILLTQISPAQNVSGAATAVVLGLKDSSYAESAGVKLLPTMSKSLSTVEVSRQAQKGGLKAWI